MRTPLLTRAARHAAHRAAAPALAAALTLGLVACSTGEPEPESPADALGNALADMREAGTGSFGFSLGDEGNSALRTEGSYDLSEESARLTITTDDGEASNSVEQVAHSDRVWIRPDLADGKSNGNAAPCWLRLGPALADPAQIGSPSYVQVALSGEGTEWVDPTSVLKGTVDLALLVNTLAGTLGEAGDDLDLDPDSTARAEVTFLLDRGALVAWRTDMASVLTAVRDTGVALSPEMEQVVTADVDFPLMAWFGDLGGDFDHEPPVSADVVEVNRRAGLVAATRACADRQKSDPQN